MTVELFRNNSYLKEHKTIISEVVPEGLVLNETIFYPEGGGNQEMKVQLHLKITE